MRALTRATAGTRPARAEIRAATTSTSSRSAPTSERLPSPTRSTPSACRPAMSTGCSRRALHLDPTRARAGRAGEAQREQPVLIAGLHALGVDRVGEGNRSLVGADLELVEVVAARISALAGRVPAVARVSARIFMRDVPAARGADGELGADEFDLDLVGVHPWQGDDDQQVGVR